MKTGHHRESLFIEDPSCTMEGLALFLRKRIDAFVRSSERGEFPILCLTGDLGAGKTTLAQRLCAYYGAEQAVSPTFTIMNNYESDIGTINHLDLYRIDDESELEETGFFDVLASGELTLIEWADRYARLIPQDAWWVRIGVEPGGTRRAEVIL